MSPLRSATRIGFPRTQMPGARRVRLARGTLARPERLPRLHPASWGKFLWLLIGLLALALLGTVLALLPDRPEVEPPRVAAPAVSTPKPRLKAPSLDAPSVGPPGLDTPSIRVPTPTLPSPGGGGDQAPSRSAPTGPEHRTELVHDHHRLFVWQLNWPLVLLALAGLAVLYPFARLPRRGQRAFGGVVAAGLLAFAVAAFVAGITPQPGPGTYEREPAEVEHSDEAIVRHVHVHHFHEPIFLVVPWLTLGFGLAVLAIPAARVAAAGQPRSVSPDAKRATT